MTTDCDIWLPGVQQTLSPNFDDRPPQTTVDLLVIHNISLPPGRFGGEAVEAFFQNRLDPSAHPYFAEIAHLRVSAHLLVRRDGHAQQFVPLNRRAWHAGASCFEGRERCNDFSIGIELEGTDDQPFSDAQYDRLVELTRAIQARYPAITRDRITGHSDIAPGRKTDPGPCFDWQRYLSRL
ncbi:MAG: 1,6-anhydro-N-acetylmuramyl-L-alanine amidase AmpD [Gammaproteobacteria bacterium]|nr:MAG: 1,6-anhydro-N-acetylmuramyl-L-alanine amidase AmpD [Gammaproteobacteria bacterium]